MSKSNDAPLNESEIYNRLTILDGKCSALLQLSAIILMIGIIPATVVKIERICRIIALFACAIFAGEFAVINSFVGRMETNYCYPAGADFCL